MGAGRDSGVKKLSRRTLLASAGAASFAAAQSFESAHGFRNDPEHVGRTRRRIHEGKGEIDVKRFFGPPDRPAKPAVLLLYDIPPGASEGVHTHNVGDVKEGSFDEFYYILSGRGEMQIDGKIVPVATGDHIFTPNGVAHGIENTSRGENLEVYLVAVMRD